MNRLLFRSCVAADGRKFAFLTDQLEVDECFDHGYKVAYKDRDGSNNPELLACWSKSFTVISETFSLLPEGDEIPPEIMDAFNDMLSSLILGIDVFFCDYNIGVEGDLPMCNEVMEKHKSTDFVLFSCADIVGYDPNVQPYMVSYAAPRYTSGSQVSQQHRIYCKTDHFAFCQAINVIVVQRQKDNLNGGHIRSDIDAYIADPAIDEQLANAALNRFVDMLKR